MQPSDKFDRLNASASAERWKQGDFFLAPLRRTKLVFATDEERLRFCFDEFSKTCTDGHAARRFRDRAVVALTFPPERRRPGLSFQHHAETLAADPGRREALLTLAERERLTPVQLRRRVAGVTARPPSLGKNLFVPLKYANVGLRWFGHETRKSPLHEWPPARRAALRREFKPLLDALSQI